MTTQRVLSGIQPTGLLHLGNYLGAIKNWVPLQDQMQCLFCIVDLHAITMPQDPTELRQATLTTLAAYLACGIDPKKSALFVQSSVPEHAELSWIFNCYTPLGWLNRMTQFKDKAGKNLDKANLGLYAYPVLMAADILLYKATHVPVGADQKQHLELARDIAGAFNRAVGQDFFPLPEPLIMGLGTRVMSLRDGTQKMSKSDVSDYSRINLLDDDDAIVQKIKKAKTDADVLPSTMAALEARPEAKNLLTLLAAVTDVRLEDVVAQHAGQNFSMLKGQLTEAMVAHLSPIRTKMHDLLKDKAQLQKMLVAGRDQARAVAVPILEQVKELIGFVKII